MQITIEVDEKELEKIGEEPTKENTQVWVEDLVERYWGVEHLVMSRMYDGD